MVGQINASGSSEDGSRFYSTSDYVLGYIALSVSSDEENEIPAALLSIFPGGWASGSRILDIGPADGRLTANLVKPGSIVSLFEPNPIFYSLALSRLAKNHIVESALPVEFHGSFEQLQNQFDLAIVCHVLYHVPLASWITYLLEIANRLRPAGHCVVVLWDEHSEARQVAMDVNPRRWLCSSKDFEDLQPQLGSFGLEVLARRQLCPTIRPHSAELADLILDFLCGKRVDVVGQDRRAAFQQRLMTTGLQNSQTIYVLQSQTGLL